MILIGVELHFCQTGEKALTVGSRNVIYFPPNVFSIVLSEYFFCLVMFLTAVFRLTLVSVRLLFVLQFKKPTHSSIRRRS